jgi:hypothetical protein
MTLTGFTIENGPGKGILGIHGAAFAVHNTTVQNNAAVGIAVGGNSLDELTGCTVRDNGSDGLDVFTSSSVILTGIITANHNAGNGITINGQSMMVIRGAQVQVNDNEAFGLVVAGSRAAIFRFAASQGSTLTLASTPTNPSVVEDNGTDVDLKFGTRATIDGVTVGSITCDATVLSRGTTVCP